MKSALDVSQRFEYEAQVYGEYSQSITKFSQAIWTLITTEVEEGSALFSPLCQILENISSCNISIADEIRRAIEDLRDIYERSVVIQRKIEEHDSLIKQYENSKLKVSEAKTNLKLYESKADYYMKRDSLESSLKELEKEQKEATRKARDGTLYLIEEKKKFQNFALRRTKSCFKRIGEAFKQNSEQSIILFDRFYKGLDAIKNEKPLSNFVLYGQETVPEETKPNVKTSVVSENENEYVLCEKTNPNQNDVNIQEITPSQHEQVIDNNTSENDESKYNSNNIEINHIEDNENNSVNIETNSKITANTDTPDSNKNGELNTQNLEEN